MILGKKINAQDLAVLKYWCKKGMTLSEIKEYKVNDMFKYLEDLLFKYQMFKYISKDDYISMSKDLNELHLDFLMEIVTNELPHHDKILSKHIMDPDLENTSL